MRDPNSIPVGGDFLKHETTVQDMNMMMDVLLPFARYRSGEDTVVFILTYRAGKPDFPNLIFDVGEESSTEELAQALEFCATAIRANKFSNPEGNSNEH